MISCGRKAICAAHTTESLLELARHNAHDLQPEVKVAMILPDGRTNHRGEPTIAAVVEPARYRKLFGDPVGAVA
jgi:hypothetical protein